MSTEKLKFANSNLPQSEEQREEMIDNVAKAYEGVMDALKIDWKNCPNSNDTPRRVAKSFVNDLMRGCYIPEPKITAFDNVDKYEGIVFQGNIKMVSICNHHFLGFTGVAHVAYIPSKDGKIIGLSKLNRVVDYYSRRPQVQENLTNQIFEHINRVCEGNLGVAVFISANHTCCSNRGIGHDSTMKTARLSGHFFTNELGTKEEFYQMINDLKK